MKISSTLSITTEVKQLKKLLAEEATWSGLPDETINLKYRRCGDAEILILERAGNHWGVHIDEKSRKMTLTFEGRRHALLCNSLMRELSETFEEYIRKGEIEVYETYDPSLRWDETSS